MIRDVLHSKCFAPPVGILPALKLKRAGSMVYPVDYSVSKHVLLIANSKPVTIFEESICVLVGANSWPVLVLAISYVQSQNER